MGENLYGRKPSLSDMIKIGKLYNLVILKKSDTELYLDGGELGKIVLDAKDVPDCQQGSQDEACGIRALSNCALDAMNTIQRPPP